MRATLTIDDELLNRAARLTGIHENEILVEMGLEALIGRAAAGHLARLAGTEKDLRPIPRRRLKKGR